LGGECLHMCDILVFHKVEFIFIVYHC
jgi:hypothetical protein